MTHLLRPELLPTTCEYNTPTVQWQTGGLVRVVDPFISTWEIGGKRFGRRVEAGYICDGPSIPQRFEDVVDWWSLIPAALGHDWDYEAHGGDRLIKVGNGLVYLADLYTGERVTRTREECDHLFYAFALLCSPPREARLAFYAVRLFGGKVWEDKEEVAVPAAPSRIAAGAIAGLDAPALSG